MGNAARHLQLVTTSPEVMETRVAQLEDGFTRVANDLLDAAMASGLSETELCILLAVWRKTYGYSKKMDWISNEQLEGMVGKHHTHCSTAKNLLINKKVLLQEGRKVGMNTNVAEWKTKVNGFCKTLAKPAKKTLAEVASEAKQKLLTTKDNIQKIKETTPNPLTGVGSESVKSTKKKPRAAPIPYQAVMDAYNETFAERLPFAETLNEDRKRGIKRIWGEMKHQTVEACAAYFQRFADTAKPFYFGESDTGWKADFDYLLRSKTLVKTREGSL